MWHQRPWHSTKTKIFTIFDPLMQLTTLRALSYTTDPWIPYFSSIHENVGMLWSASFAPFRKVASINYFFCDIVYGTPAAAESAAVAVGLKLWVCMSSWPKFHTFFPPLSSWGLITNWIQLIQCKHSRKSLFHRILHHVQGSITISQYPLNVHEVASYNHHVLYTIFIILND